ncbi:MAG: sulfite oxidase [Methylobacteriaceae bacterium]|nr:sulfite oxidase [Methylobacteriaceae bacterium]
MSRFVSAPGEGREPGLIVRQSSPLNLEYPFSTLDDFLVPQDRFYVRNHFPCPRVERDGWRLKVGGEVARELSLGLDDLHALPAVTLPAVMECAGNGRVFYEPAKEGLQWANGAVGNASWTGVRLDDVLDRAGLRDGAVEVVLVGADRGPVDGGKKTSSPGPIAFARSLPLTKARSDGVVLAYAMNGEPLTPDHGAPLRAVVGGWFGMAWVKWLAELRVVSRPFLGYWQARDYFRWDRSFGEPILVPLTEMEPKAQIARPVQGGSVEVGRPTRIFGAAWSGEAPVAEVAVDTGEGAWRPATLLEPATEHGWRLWEHWWTPTAAGPCQLRCRARDAAGRVQPETPQTDRESYCANWVIPVGIRVVPAAQSAEPEFVI